MTVVPAGNVRVMAWGAGAKDAVTDCGEFIVTVQPAVPAHGPPHPTNVLVPLLVAVKLTTVPTAYVAVLR